MLRLRPAGDAQREREGKSQAGLPFALSPSINSGQATRQRSRRGSPRADARVLSPFQKGFLYTQTAAAVSPGGCSPNPAEYEAGEQNSRTGKKPVESLIFLNYPLLHLEL